MEITVASIIAFVTLIIGAITKKFNIVNKKFIPIQNIVIGILSGLLVFLTGLDNNIFSALVTCLMSSLSAGGLYDSITIRKEKINEN